MFQHILVPLDGSSRAEQALPVAAQIARATGGSLLLVQVISPLFMSGGLSLAPLVNEQAIEAEMATATAYLQELAASPKLSGIKTRIEILPGLPVQHLLAFAEAPEIDLVVLCSHGRTGFARWVLGSVAYALIHQCTRPILVLRPNEASSALARFNRESPLRTLVPLDGSPLAEAALRPAASLTSALASPGQGALHLSQVVKIFPTTADEGFISKLNEEALQRAGAYLSQMQERVRSEGKDLHLSFTYSVELASDVASTLLNLAEHGRTGGEKAHGETGQCDLIAISTHGRGGLERWVMGSVTERLLTTTQLPMLIVRPLKEGGS